MILDIIIVVLEKTLALHVLSPEFGTRLSLVHEIVLLQKTAALARVR